MRFYLVCLHSVLRDLESAPFTAAHGWVLAFICSVRFSLGFLSCNLTAQRSESASALWIETFPFLTTYGKENRVVRLHTGTQP